MTDTALENAKAARRELTEKIEEAERQIAEWRVKLSHAERFIADWEVFARGESPAAVAAEPAVPNEPSRERAKRPVNPKKEEVADAAREILLGRGHPMSRDDLFAALTESGVEIHGQNPPVVLQTMLWRMRDRVIHLKGHGYWPADTPWPEGGYDPLAQTEADPEPAEYENDPALI